MSPVPAVRRRRQVARMSLEHRDPVLHAVGRLAAVPGRIVLAVSGGADSMVLLDAAARLPGASGGVAGG
jgi:tRNA(Ile)-lysidine synthase TilS/MesJ